MALDELEKKEAGDAKSGDEAAVSSGDEGDKEKDDEGEKKVFLPKSICISNTDVLDLPEVRRNRVIDSLIVITRENYNILYNLN